MQCPCGKPVKPHEKGRYSKYCSVKCANRYRKQRERQRENVTKKSESVTSVAVEGVTVFQRMMEATAGLSFAAIREQISGWMSSIEDLEVREMMIDQLTMNTVEALQVLQLKPVYLSLPPVIASLERDDYYQAGLPFGYAQYSDECEDHPPGCDWWVCLLWEWEPEEVYTRIQESILIQDAQIALMTPLAFRVGFQVGWLSVLAMRQRDIAINAMAYLAVVVAPLLPSFSVDTSPQKKLRGRT